MKTFITVLKTRLTSTQSSPTATSLSKQAERTIKLFFFEERPSITKEKKYRYHGFAKDGFVPVRFSRGIYLKQP